MAMATLLLQPPELIPAVIFIDEPELGLHPVAISALAGMIYRASEYSQVIVATQSPRLIDEFEANIITVVERDERTKRSLFKKLDEEALIEEIRVFKKNKSTVGPNVVESIGVPNLKNKCRHFKDGLRSWKDLPRRAREDLKLVEQEE
ncbi:MAG: AAA family ATPase [Acidobacteria bacterium]|jgi:ABC-type multidrug transport system ATPase subunit|nr:AAA family ATPase [Acidobacteriota bacterium]